MIDLGILEILLSIYKDYNHFEININDEFVEVRKLDEDSFNSLIGTHIKHYEFKLINHRATKIFLFKTPKAIKMMISRVN